MADSGGWPEGDVTFLLADMVGSTAVLEDLGAQGFGAMATDLFAVLGSAVVTSGGTVVKTEGDGLMAAFADPASALRAAVDGQGGIARHDWLNGPRPSVRMALHRGEALIVDHDYVSLALHRAARLMSAPHGGQIIASPDVLAGVDLDTQGLVAHLLGAYWVRDFREALPLRQIQRASEACTDFPALAVPRADLTNVSERQVDLIGRDTLIESVVIAVESARVVTLVGPGGVGKTAVAVAVAQRLAERGDAAWLVELASVSTREDESAESVEQRLVAALGRSLGMTETEPRLVFARLAARTVVVVLDNCEHVIEAVRTFVTELLTACPSARVLATSREPLQLADETVAPVEPLELPPSARDGDTRPLTDYDAVRLFVGRARQSNPGFRVDRANEREVSELCRQLDGLPLALELAGTSTRHTPPDVMLERLEAVGSLPSRGARSSQTRHASLEALVGWSLDSCTPEEVAVFRRLGAFAGPVPAEAVTAVCADDGWTKWDVLDVLARLADKSLVVPRVDDDVTRYDVLVTLRRRGRRLLEEVGEADSTMRRHMDWVLTKVRALRDISHGEARQTESVLVREALSALDRAPDLDLSTSDWVDLVSSGLLRLGVRAPHVARRLTEQLLAREDLTMMQRSHLLSLRIRSFGGDPINDDLVREAIEVARDAGDNRDLIVALIVSSQGASGAVDVRTGSTEFSPVIEEAGRVFEQLGSDPRVEVVYRNARGIEYTRIGDLDAARTEYARAKAIAARLNDRFNVATAIYNIAEVDELGGDVAGAAAAYADAARMFAVEEFHLQTALSAHASALAYQQLGDSVEAADQQADAVLAARRAGNSALLVAMLLFHARLAVSNGDVSLARSNVRDLIALDPDGPAADEAEELLQSIPISA